ncbi:hypothetical protein D030_3595A, partial [Vibrio parahaemolyticus AQ3810]
MPAKRFIKHTFFDWPKTRLSPLPPVAYS